jgi:hypothetical protein
MSSERVTTATPDTDQIDAEELNDESKRLAADLQRLRDLFEQNRVGAARLREGAGGALAGRGARTALRASLRRPSPGRVRTCPRGRVIGR